MRTQTLLSTLTVLCGSTIALALPNGDLTTNGGFELGNTSSWQSFPTANSTFNTTSDANSGAFAAELFNNDQAAGAVIKQANLAAGVVAPGDEVKISFAAKGSFANGGVAFAEFFSEVAGGGVSGSELLSGGPLMLTDEWQSFSFTTTAGPDVSGGITLQFAAVTGAVDGSTAVLFIDDASVKIGDLAVNGDFETGDTSGWESFPTATSTFTTTSDSNTGAFGAELFNNDPASGAVVKQANVGIGEVNPGDFISICFAAKGSSAEGGVAIAEFFSELDGGGTSSSEILGGGPLPLTDDWQTFRFTTLAGPDVSGGVSLQFVAATGGAPGSTSVVFIDDVLITAGSGALNYCEGGTNSDGQNAFMSVSGSVSVAANDLALEANDVADGSGFGLFVMGDTQAAAPFASGTLCVDLMGQFFRLNPIVVGGSNNISRPLDNTAPPASVIVPGSIWNFQYWYRDGQAGTNLTDGIRVCFTN